MARDWRAPSLLGVRLLVLCCAAAPALPETFAPAADLQRLQADLRSRLDKLCPVCEMACRINASWGVPGGPMSGAPSHVIAPRTANQRGPDFLLIGTQKGGTTDLYARMQRDSNFKLRDVQTCKRGKRCKGEKELHFFDWMCLGQGLLGHGRFRFRARKPMWCDASKYAAHFEEQRSGGGGGGGGGGNAGPFFGEATSNYIYHPEVPPMARQVFPGAKIVALLRDPADRAFSGYYQHFGKQAEPFEAAINHEAAVVERCQTLMPHDGQVEHQFIECIYPLFTTEVLENTLQPGGRWETQAEYKRTPRLCNPGFVRWMAHVTRGLYYFQLLRWLRHYPPEQVVVLRSEDYFAEPNVTMAAIVAFLKGTVSPKEVAATVAALQPKPRAKSTGVYQNSQSKGTLAADVRGRLNKLYHPYNKLLFELLAEHGMPMSPWKDAPN